MREMRYGGEKLGEKRGDREVEEYKRGGKERNGGLGVKRDKNEGKTD